MIKTVDIELNRVEGDLEFEVDLDGQTIVDARCKGTMYRGFEQLLIGRAPKDAIVFTPRVCGICGTAHMHSTVKALEMAWNIPVAKNGTRIRNLCTMAESLQSDIRQCFLFFTVDFCNPSYAKRSFFDRAKMTFEPFKGSIYRSAIQASRWPLEIVAIWGGQWPHSSFMVPGGVTAPPTTNRILESNVLVRKVLQWYESEVLGGTMKAWEQVSDLSGLETWRKEHPKAGISLFDNCCHELNLDKIGVGTSHMISYGVCQDAETWTPPYGQEQEKFWMKSGFFNGDNQTIETLDQRMINEHVRHSYFMDYGGGRHPYEGETIPHFIQGDRRYTWAKAPRYGEKVVQTGPLAELLISGDPLTQMLYAEKGDSTWLRQFSRLHRMGLQIKKLLSLLEELSQNIEAPHILDHNPRSEVDGEGFGLVQAARGSLGHWIKIEDGLIAKYQIVTPTAWNASPKDSTGQSGHWESSIIGLKLEDPDQPLEIGHIIRSHDPCLVCTVHAHHLDDDTHKQYCYGI